MGKNLKGRECGKGICQRKDGKYSARYIARDGSRREKYFDMLPEARSWLADTYLLPVCSICGKKKELIRKCIKSSF